MKVDVVRPGELGPAEHELWRGFQRATPEQRNPFLSPEFTRVVGDLRPRTRVGVLSEGGPPVGFLAFERGPLGRGVPVAPGLTDAQGVVHAPGLDYDPRELVRACGLAVWEFDHLVADHGPMAPFRAVSAASPVMDLSAGYEAYLDDVRRRSSRVRDLPRRSRRLAREVGPVRLVLDAADPVALDTVLAWKSAQYRRTGRTDRFARPWVRRLVERLLLERDDSFRGLLSLLYAGDELVAGHFGLRAHRVVPTWFPAYSPELGRYSPGLLLHLGMAEAAAADGVDHIDMGRGAKPYKDELKTRDLVVSEGRVARRVPGAALAWARTAPGRTARVAVSSHPGLYDAADRVLRTYARSRAAFGPSK